MGNFMKYTDEMKEFLKNNAPGKSYQEITFLFNNTFKLDKTITQISSFLKKHKIRTGLFKTFKKGNIPHNKGKKYYPSGRAIETQFKKGHIPSNYRPIGSERIDSDGYTYVKTSDPKTWKLKHRIIWEQKYGPVPSGHIVIFGDGNKQNFDIHNLILVSRRELVVLNNKKLIFNNPEATKAGIKIAKITIKLNSLERKNNKT